ncbi:MAG: hypothetical protein Q4B22_06145 [Eubacteriales bacterium]|nr:hypothetical protein [Eubacteriales bacterium]
MLTLLFAICLLSLSGRFLVWGIRASWGILKVITWVLFFPLILIGMACSGLLYIAFIILIIGTVVSLITGATGKV